MIKKCIAGADISTGLMVESTGKTKLVYEGQLFKPLTWFKFERVPIIKPLSVDHIAVVEKSVMKEFAFILKRVEDGIIPECMVSAYLSEDGLCIQIDCDFHVNRWETRYTREFTYVQMAAPNVETLRIIDLWLYQTNCAIHRKAGVTIDWPGTVKEVMEIEYPEVSYTSYEEEEAPGAKLITMVIENGDTHKIRFSIASILPINYRLSVIDRG